MKRNRTGGRAVEPLLESIWPFLALVIVLVALAFMDFLFVEPAHASRLLLLVLRIAASIALLMLAGVTLRRLFIERSRLAEALAASEERLVSSLSDIQKRTQAEALLFEEKERAQVTLASIADAVVTVDTAGRIEFLNPVAERLTGWPLDEARQRPVADVFAVVDEATGAPIADPVRHALTDGAVIEADGNVVLLCRGAESIAIDYSVAPIRDRGARIVGAVLVIQDMSRERQYAARLSNLASHDALTGLLNRREFEQRVRAIVEHHDAEDGQHAVLYLDLDQFKVVNDTSGHAAGDELLRQVGALLRPRLREGDVLARLGGDEFGVLLPHCPPAPALRIAEALRKAIVDFRFAWKNRSFTIGVSIGLVNLADGPHTLASALSAADAACYLAKDKGRNRVQVYRPEDSEVALRRGEMEWVHRLHRALAEDRLCLFSQPIRAMHAPGAHSDHQELLVRLIDENNELIPPIAFIPAAERYHLMPSIDRWVIRTAFRVITERRAAGNTSGTYAINISGASIGDDQFLDYVRESFARFRIPHASICFEITETTAVTSLSKAADFIGALREPGCRFALDDFGVGVSSFTYLKQLPVDYLKIDGSFVKNMLTDPVDAAMVEAIHRIGRVMGKQTIAESVETAATLDALRSVGVDYAQGHAIAPPSMFAPPGTRSRHAAERGRSESERLAPSSQRAVLVSRVSHDRTNR
ncbi:MAG TPA: EAL domain-containing protein [Casimicrobiaceae bacterium]|nr:EAL domain-containing protein [Casimicrobiaceae bacterium]HXU67327.1 EAL domain-containing protein [Casimicrobiaceae bacterium]